MIAIDQPDNLADGICVRVSSRDDGTMLDRSGVISESEIVKNRQDFTRASGIGYEDCVNQYIVYGEAETYDRLIEVGERETRKYIEGVTADALFTKARGVGLFLPVADCVATVVHDPVNQLLALLHLGRHSTLTDLIQRTVAKFKTEGSEPRNLIVWMSPSIQKSNYRLEYFEPESSAMWQYFRERRDDGVYIDMQGYNRQRFINEGVLPENTHLSSVDTAVNPDYFSHAMGDKHGRMAVVAYLK